MKRPGGGWWTNGRKSAAPARKSLRENLKRRLTKWTAGACITALNHLKRGVIWHVSRFYPLTDSC